MATPAPHTSTITAATVRVAGPIQPDITVSHLGTPEQQAGLRFGELLIYVRNANTIEHVARTWTTGRTASAQLPRIARPGQLRLPPRAGLVGLVVRLGGLPHCLTSWEPGNPGVAQPPHVRVKVGPVLFEVCDLAAWQSLGRAWNLTYRHLADIDHGG